MPDLDGIVPDESLWDAIRDCLEARRRETFEALRNYPPQVAGCDTHYQYLAERRAKISGELRQLDALRRDDDRQALKDFVRASDILDAAAIRALQATLSC